MGKTLAAVYVTNYPVAVHRDISRAAFMRAVEAGIAKALDYERTCEIGGVFPAERVRIEARAAHKMDALAWKCKDSCGCPMTNFGIVELVADRDSALAARGAAGKFATAYDAAVRSELGLDNEHSVTLTIQDAA